MSAKNLKNFHWINKKTKCKTQTKEPNLRWIDNINTEVRSLEEQLPFIISQLEVHPSFYKDALLISQELKKILSSIYENHILEVIVFGSAEARLALKDSDVDIFVDFKGDVPENFLMCLSKVMRQGRVFFRPFVIKAKVPLLKCYHRSRISCDISYSNTHGIINTKLLQLFIEFDKRIKPIILILKFLMKKQELKSHSLITLIVFFLQQLENPLIPTIRSLQMLINTKKLIDGWDISFSTDCGSIKLSENSATIPELLTQFFKFYSSFEFTFYIISTYTGKSYLKSLFSNLDMIPNEFACYKENLQTNKCNEIELHKCMCVQDFFCHSNNVTRNVNHKNLIQFQDFCLRNYTLCEELGKNESSQNKFYIELFKRNFKKDSKAVCEIPSNVIYAYLNENLKNCNAYTEEGLVNYWCQVVFSKLTDILIKVLKCNVNSQEKANFLREAEHMVSSDTIKLFKCEFLCLGLVSSVRKEAKLEFEFPNNMNIISQQEIISNYLCDTSLKNLVYSPLTLVIGCDLKKNPIRMHLRFEVMNKGNPKKNCDQHLLSFQKYVMKWLQASI